MTMTLRNQCISSINRRLNDLKTEIRKYITEENHLDPITVNAFEYRYATEKHRAFMDWLKEQEEKGILETVIRRIPYRNIPDEQPWINTYIWTSYQRGLQRGRMELRAQTNLSIPTYSVVDDFLLSPLFNAPFHSEAVGLLFTRAYSDLKGVTEAMDATISRTLAQGMSEGLGTEQIARNIASNVDNIGKVRARTLARTEIVKAYNDAKLNDYEAMESIVEEEILVQWRTAGDERVRRPRHTSRHNKVYHKKEARRLLGEPNCRCAILPYLESTQGEIRNNQWGPINPMEGR